MTSTNQDSYVYAGLILETTVLSQASTAGSNANIGKKNLALVRLAKKSHTK